MSKDDYIEMKGEVVDAMRNAQYKWSHYHSLRMRENAFKQY